MIKIHHLNNSRSQRILWLLEELEIEHEIVTYQRDPVTRLAPAELKAVHPLGKSPVITDGERMIAESGAIIEYVLRTYGKGRLAPDPSSPDFYPYVQWLHFAEGSAMTPLLLALYVGMLGEAGSLLWPRIGSEIATHLGYMAAELGERDFFVGDDLTAADIQLTFVLEAADAGGRLKDHPNLTRYLARMQARPAYQRAIARGGPYSLIPR